jgi:hypothetical protein
MINNPQGHDMTDGLAIPRDDTTEAALAKVHSERSGILARLAEHDAKRSQLLESDDVTTIDAADLKAAADRRAVAILDKKIKALSVRVWREECDRLEVDRAKAIKKITGIYARRTAKGARAEELLAELAAVILDIRADSEACSAAWKLGGLPSWFTWRHDVVADLMPSMYRALGDLMPSNVRQAISFHAHSGSPGYTEAPHAGPPPPRDVPGLLDANAKSVLESLRKADIRPPSPAAEANAERAA